MDKPHLLALIVATLAHDLDVLTRAAQTAYEAATAEENIAENKYDTLGLEASYLATGQARRCSTAAHGVGFCGFAQASAHEGGFDRGVSACALRL